MNSDNNTKTPAVSTAVTPFETLGLIDPLLKALAEEGYERATPIQTAAIPHVLAGRDLLGCAQTGTGKTAAFALPILQLLSGNPPVNATRSKVRALILTPTRELAAQITESFERYGRGLKLGVTVIFGGVGQGAQVNAIRRGTEILVATPGRLLDLIEQRHVSLEGLEIFVLDEADRMLDMGFIHDVKRILKIVPRKRQSLFFSATMPPDIQALAQQILQDPVRVEVTPVATTAEKIDQRVYFVEGQETKRALLEHVLKDPSIHRALVFTRTKHGADRVARFLNGIQVSAEAIHGNKSQNNRVRALDNFKAGQTRVLVATDIAARGIDIDDVSHVINFEIPNVPETYVHRIGRTARAGAEGISFSFCDQEERGFLRDIERLIRQPVPVETNHPFAGGQRGTPSRDEAAGPRLAPGAHRGGGRSGPRSGDSRGGARSSPRSGGGAGNRPAAAHARSGSGRSSAPARGDARPAGGVSRTGGRGDSHTSGGGAPRPGASGSRSSGRGPARSSHPPSHRGGSARRASESSTRKETGAPSGPTTKKPWWKRLVGSE